MKASIFEKEIIYKEISYRINGAIFEVHNQLGPGFTENVYQQALIYELEARQIPYETQKPITVTYKGKPAGTYRLDLVIDEKIIFELKAVPELTQEFHAQLISYLKATGLKLGLLVNFGKNRAQIIRIPSGMIGADKNTGSFGTGF
jgi:GxxExxY protein